MSIIDISAADAARLVDRYLLPNTPIPTAVRPAIRHIVRMRWQEFNEWSMGLYVSRNIPNRVLIMFGRAHPRGLGIVMLDLLTKPEDREVMQ